MAVKLEEYFRTIFQEKFLVKMPEQEDDHLTPATRLLEKRREMAEVDQALAAQKEEFQMKMESLQQRREELERKECQLKESLLKFDKFLKENDSKKARAHKKAHDEKEISKVKDREIERLKEELDQLTARSQRLHRKLSKYVIFHNYLEKVLERSDFHETREIMARYDTLFMTREDLLDQEQRNQERIESLRQDLLKYTEEKSNEILSYNNQLAGLQTRLDKAQSDAVMWESKWNHIKNTAAKRTLLLGKIKMATYNLYQLVRQHQRGVHDEIAMENTNDQLKQIQDYIEDLSQITLDIKKQMESGYGATSYIADTSSS